VRLSKLAANSAATLLCALVSRYIIRQRDQLAPQSLALSETTKSRLSGYFSAIELERVRIVESDSMPIPEPPFATALRRFGIDFPSVALTTAITFDHVIACREPVTASLLMHEMIHVVQYRLLGVTGFTRRYIRGFLMTGAYDAIPLELCACELTQRLTEGNKLFNVEKEILKWIQSDRF
jgi:hypothetical protein